MSNSIIQGLRIVLRAEYTQDTSIGLYTSAGISWFRWIETALSGTEDEYKEGILLQGGISQIKESVDTLTGGGVAKVGGISLKVDNTSRLWFIMDTLGIDLNGCKVEVYDFEEDVITDIVTQTTIYYGEINLDRWNEVQYSIPVTGTQYKRNAQILTLIDTVAYPNADDKIIGKAVPATFGLLNATNFFAKLLRVANAESAATPNGVLWVFPGTNYAINTDISDESAFPIVGNDGEVPTRVYNVKIGSYTAEGGYTEWFTVDPPVEITSGEIDLTVYFENFYLKVIDGLGEDRCRKIVSAIIADVADDPSVLQVTVQDYFEETLSGNATATAANQSWVEFLSVARQYQIDVWPCFGFLDSATGNLLTSRLELYAYSDSKKSTIDTVPQIVWDNPYQFMRLPQYAYREIVGGTDHNILDLDVSLFDRSPDDMNSFLLLPIVSPALCNQNTLVNWLGPDFDKITSGLYSDDGSSTGKSLSVISGALSNIVDRLYADAYSYLINIHLHDDFEHRVAFVLEFRLPPIPEDFDFDSVYVLTDVEFSNLFHYYIRWRRWIGSPIADVQIDPEQPSCVKGLPDFYYTDTIVTNNKHFYYTSRSYAPSGGELPGGTIVFSGFSNFQLSGVSSKEIYNSISRAAFILYRGVGAHISDDNLCRIREIAVAFRKIVNIKDDIHSPFKGRIFNSTWGSFRKTEENLIDNLGDLFEHVCRLQNWSEVGSSAVPGKEYSTEALINTTSFDATDQSYLQSMKIGFQLYSDKLGYTEAFKRDIARAGFFINYVNELGEESIATLQPTTEGITDTITLAHVPDDENIGEVLEPDIKSIYCEPCVRYQYNAAAGGYNKIARVTNIQEAAWTANYTPGIDVTNGEILWDKCKILYTRFQHLESAPSEMTDQYMFYESATAIAFLGYWIDWMAKRRITVPVHYITECPSAVRFWHVGRHIYLNLPHQTNGSAKECLIGGITKDKNAGIITLDLIIL